jgi:hypothetical protein
MTYTYCCVYSTLDDGHKIYPKHVDFYCKNKFEKFVHLVGFITRILRICIAVYTLLIVKQSLQTSAALTRQVLESPSSALRRLLFAKLPVSHQCTPAFVAIYITTLGNVLN